MNQSSIGGKIASVIPDSRIPRQTLENELDRVKRLISRYPSGTENYGQRV